MSNSSRLKEGSEVETLRYTEICTGVYLNMAHKNKTNKAAAWYGGIPVQLQHLGDQGRKTATSLRPVWTIK